MSARKGKRVVSAATVGPGLHLGTVDLQIDGAYVVRLTAGARVTARLDPEVPASFVEECMRSKKRVLVVDDERGATIVGALERPVDVRPASVAIHGEIVRLSAEKELTLQVGELCIRLDQTGTARLKGRQLVVDAASLVRFLSARVELP
jgi:hypothetical protein